MCFKNWGPQELKVDGKVNKWNENEIPADAGNANARHKTPVFSIEKKATIRPGIKKI